MKAIARSIHGSRRRLLLLRIGNVGLIVILLAGLVAIRVADSQRDRRDAVLVSLLQLNALFSEMDASRVVPPGDLTSARVAELRYTEAQISQRLPYLRRQGLSQRAVDDLNQLIDRFRQDSNMISSFPTLDTAENQLANDSHAFLVVIMHDTETVRASYGRWDKAVDGLTIAVLAAGASIAAVALMLTLLPDSAPRESRKDAAS